MIELLMTVCLIGQPSECKVVALTYLAEAVTPHQCVMRAMPEVSKWLVSHPKYRVEKWSCRVAGQVAKI